MSTTYDPAEDPFFQTIFQPPPLEDNPKDEEYEEFMAKDVPPITDIPEAEGLIPPPKHFYEFTKPENMEWLNDRFNYLKNSRSWQLMTGGIPTQDKLFTQYKIDPLYGGEIIPRHSAELPSARVRHSRQLALAELSMAQWHSMPYETMLKFGFVSGAVLGFSIGFAKLVGNIAIAIAGVATIPLYLAEKHHIPTGTDYYRYYRVKTDIQRHNVWHTFNRYVDKFIPKTKSVLAREKRQRENQSVNLYQYLRKRKDFDKHYKLPQKPMAPAPYRMEPIANLLRKHRIFREWIYNHKLSELSRNYRLRYQMLPTDSIPAFGRFTILCTYLYPKFKFGTTLVTRMVPFVWKHVKYSSKVGPYFFLSLKFHMTITAYIYYHLPWDIRKNIQTAHGFWYLFVFSLAFRNWLWFIGRLGPEPPKVTKALVLPLFLCLLVTGYSWDNLVAGVHGYTVTPPPQVLKENTSSGDPRMILDFFTAIYQNWVIAKHRIQHPGEPDPVFPPISITYDPNDPAETAPDRPQLSAREMLNQPEEWMALRSPEEPKSSIPRNPFPQWHVASRKTVHFDNQFEDDIPPPDISEEEYELKKQRKASS